MIDASFVEALGEAAAAGRIRLLEWLFRVGKPGAFQLRRPASYLHGSSMLVALTNEEIAPSPLMKHSLPH
ncbi:hypothetical protein AB4Z13_26495 [Rhizobium sp. YAF28]|jgi:hypothetical protein|uniref:hypothetical protein n=1 Tax=Rhizobium sp. YAF28 TaxID=3233081 RepID=UPI003F971C1E